MFDSIIEMFQYDFMIRAIIAGVLVSLCASLLGVSLVLKRYSMIGDGLSHVGFGALAIASAANIANLTPLEFAIPIVVIAAFFLLRISESGKMKGDSAIALISTSSLAIGITVAQMSTGLNTDINSYLFGSIISLDDKDLILCVILSCIVLVLFILFYNKIFAVTFDESFARATGTRTGLYNMVIAFLTALTIVVGMKMMGAIMISAIIIFPALTAMRLTGSFRRTVILSAAVSVACFLVGFFAACLFSLQTGAAVVTVNLAVFCAVYGLAWLAGKIKQKRTA